MDFGCENAQQAKCRFAEEGPNKGSFEVLYADGLRREKATKLKEAKPTLMISPAFQNYIKDVNLDPEQGDTLWRQLKRCWPNAPRRAEQVCRLVVRALRNKRSAHAAQQNGKRAREEDKATIETLTKRVKMQDELLKENAMWMELITRATNASKACKSTAIQGLTAVRMLKEIKVGFHTVAPIAQTLFECNEKTSTVRPLGGLCWSEPLALLKLSDNFDGVCAIGKDQKTHFISNEL